MMMPNIRKDAPMQPGMDPRQMDMIQMIRSRMGGMQRPQMPQGGGQIDPRMAADREAQARKAAMAAGMGSAQAKQMQNSWLKAAQAQRRI
jgi:hypothetical protein